VAESGILQWPGQSNAEDDKQTDQKLIVKAALQATVYQQLIHSADSRARLMLSNYHPQCYNDSGQSSMSH
jgi:hypothetical protein